MEGDDSYNFTGVISVVKFGVSIDRNHDDCVIDIVLLSYVCTTSNNVQMFSINN